MAFDATFWVAISFIIFFGVLVYFKIPQQVNELLGKMINDIKNEISESEKLRSESKVLLDNAQLKLDTAQNESKKIIDSAKKDSENLIIEMNDKFYKSTEIKKNSAQLKIKQMKDAAIKEIKDTSIKLAVNIIKENFAKSEVVNKFFPDMISQRLVLVPSLKI